jgi:dCMP deaminase
MRPSIPQYFMDLARMTARRATCPRKNVGAVITQDDRQIASGYNGAPAGLPHCTDVGCDMRDVHGKQSCVRTTHAEVNAIATAARMGSATKGATMYCTLSPCLACAKAIVAAGITRVVWADQYSDNDGIELLKEAGIALVRSCPVSGES